MRRREFIAGLGGAVAWPVAAQAQRPAVGLLHGVSAVEWADGIAAFRTSLGEIGFAEGRNVAIEYRWSDGQDRQAAGSGGRPHPPQGGGPRRWRQRCRCPGYRNFGDQDNSNRVPYLLSWSVRCWVCAEHRPTRWKRHRRYRAVHRNFRKAPRFAARARARRHQQGGLAGKSE